MPSLSNARRTLTKKSTAFAPHIHQAVAIPLDTAQDNYGSSSSSSLADADAWVADLDYDGFGKEVAALGKKLIKEGGQDDVDHLNKLVSWRNAAAVSRVKFTAVDSITSQATDWALWEAKQARLRRNPDRNTVHILTFFFHLLSNHVTILQAIGIATMWMSPNPVSIVALSTWTYASWAMIAHHTCHGGYNRVDAGNFNSRGFAIGSVFQRGKDWLDWMMPEAWNVEHNRLHHYRLNEAGDPDLVERNMQWVRGADDMPMITRYGIVAFFMVAWKWAYYAPNTYKELKLAEMAKEGKPLPQGFNTQQSVSIGSFLVPRDESERALPGVVKPMDFYSKVLAPFFLTRFVLLPAPLLAIPGVGPALFGHAIVNLIAAEILTNAHAFATIVTNHCGDDMYTFDDAVKPKSSAFYVRQIVGSANYATGDDVTDFSHGWLNYQIEHHVWPDLSMLAYQKGAPELKNICAKYGVPYVQENVFERLRKTVDIMVGKTTMRPFPTQYEPSKDKMVHELKWKSTEGAIDGEGV